MVTQVPVPNDFVNNTSLFVLLASVYIVVLFFEVRLGFAPATSV